MFKRGVTERGEFARQALEREGASKGWWPFAYTLLAPWRSPVNRLVQRSASRRLVPLARERLQSHLRGDAEADAVREVSLFHPYAVRRASEGSGFILRRHSLFDPNAVAAHVVRAMNVLTTDQFSPELVAEAMGHAPGESRNSKEPS